MTTELAPNTPPIPTYPNGSATITGPLPAGTNQIGHVITDTGSVATVSGNVGSTDGTTIASNLTGDSGQNAQLVAGTRKEVSFTTTTVQAVASTDCSNYRSVSVHVVTQGGSSTVNFQCSNDNTNWTPIALMASNSTGSTTGSTSTNGAGVFYGPLPCRYFRLNVTGIISGTTAGVCEFFSVAVPVIVTASFAAANGTTTVQEVTRTLVANGSFVPNTSAAQLPNIAAHLAYITAAGSNTGKIYVGGATVTSTVNATNTTTGLELAAGAQIGPLPITNLNQLYGIGTVATDALTYLVI